MSFSFVRDKYSGVNQYGCLRVFLGDEVCIYTVRHSLATEAKKLTESRVSKAGLEY